MDLHVEVRGQGAPTLVFLHAFAASGAAFATMVKGLAERRRCVSVDLRGFGRSPPAGEHSVDRHAEDILSVVTSMIDGPFVLVGHSMGGKIAMAAAARRPEGLAGLVLLAPSPPTPEPISDVDRADRLAAYGDATSARATLGMITRAPIASDSAERFVADALACSLSAWDWWLRSGSREDISARVPAIAAPLLVIVGALDPVIRLGVLDAPLLEKHPSAALTLLAGTGHLLPNERPAECIAVMTEFLNRLDR